MQFSIFTVTVLASAGVAHAGVVDLLSGRQATSSECQYAESSYFAVCTAGNNLFCTGDIDVCQYFGKKDGFDDKATKDNEDACADKEEGDTCVQVIHCCPEQGK